MSNIRKSYIFIVLLSIILCLSLFGCKQNNAVNDGLSKTYVSTNDGTPLSTQLNTTDKQPEKNSTTIINNELIRTTSALDKANITSTTAVKNGSAVISTTAETKTAKTAEKATTATTTTTTTTTESASLIKCTVTVDCSKILENKEKLKDDHEQYLNGNGIMLNCKSVTVKQGDTVYDALKKVCAENSIPLNVKESRYGSYIIGINNIDEKDCGSASGWLYMVNGTSPNMSISKYVLSNGDSIVFTYTC